MQLFEGLVPCSRYLGSVLALPKPSQLRPSFKKIISQSSKHHPAQSIMTNMKMSHEFYAAEFQ